jgi:hypothetical protein
MTKSSENMMSEDRFIDLVECYGVDPENWPVSERTDGLMFREQNPERAREICAESEQLDHLLETGRRNSDNTDLLAARILKMAQETAQDGYAANDQKNNQQAPLPHIPSRRQSPWKSIAATLVITTGIGFAAGQTAAANSDRYDVAEALLSLDDDTTYEAGNVLEELQ